jgi:hypothetical protein
MLHSDDPSKIQETSIVKTASVLSRTRKKHKGKSHHTSLFPIKGHLLSHLSELPKKERDQMTADKSRPKPPRRVEGSAVF